MVNGTPGYMAPELFSMADPVPSHDLYAAGVVALVALNGKIKLHDGAFRPDELNQYLRGATPKLSAVIRKLLAAQPEERYQDANAVRRELPRVPPGSPLTHADGAPLDLADTMPPMPQDAPGAQRPERPAGQVAPSSMEAIRAGRIQQGFSPPTSSPGPASPGHPSPGPASAGHPSPQTGPRWSGGAPGAPPGQHPPAGRGHGGPGRPVAAPGRQPGTAQPAQPRSMTRTAARTISGTFTGPRGARNRNVLFAMGLGVGAAVILGVIVAVTLLVLFPQGGSAGAPSSLDGQFAEVEVGQACVAEDVGVIALTPEGQYVSCSPADDGHAFS